MKKFHHSLVMWGQWVEQLSSSSSAPESVLVQITGELPTIMYCQCRTNKCEMINIELADLHVLHY